MLNTYNEATPQRPEGDRVINANLVLMNIAQNINQLKSEKPWHNSDRNAITLFKSDELRIVLIALKKDAEMKKHTANGRIIVQVIEGQIAFITNEHEYELSAMQMITLQKQKPHGIVSKEESVILLTITDGE